MNAQLEKQILSQGMSLENAKEQLKNFKEGFPFLPIERAATIGDGIKLLTDDMHCAMRGVTTFENSKSIWLHTTQFW